MKEKISTWFGAKSKPLFITFFLMTLSLSSYSQFAFQNIKDVSIPGCNLTTNSQLFCAIEGKDGNFYASGLTSCNSTGSVAMSMIIKYNNEGNSGATEWSKTYFNGEFLDMIEDNNGDLVSIGYQANSTQIFALQKTKKDGTVLYSNTYDNGTSSVSVGSAVIEVKNANGVYDGYLGIGYLGNSLYLVRTQNDLTIPSSSSNYWEKTYSVNGATVKGYDVIQNSNGNYVLTATLNSGLLILEIDPSGNIINQNRLNVATSLYGFSIRPISSGYIIAGQTGVEGIYIKLNAALSVTDFESFTNGTDRIFLYSAVEESSGNILIQGNRMSSPTSTSNSFIAEISGSTITQVNDYIQSNFWIESYCMEPCRYSDGYIVSGFAKNNTGTASYPYIVKTLNTNLSCGNSSSSLTISPVTYTNTINNSFVINQNSTYTATAITTVALNITDVTGCTECANTINIYGSDQDPTHRWSIYSNGQVELWVNPITNATYEWTETGSPTNILSTSPNLWIYNDNISTSYTYQVKITLPTGCIITATKTVLQLRTTTNPLNAIIDFSYNCATTGTDVEFTNSSAVYDPDGIYTWDQNDPNLWHWDFGDPGSGTNNTATTFSPTHNYVNPGDYTVILQITPPFGGSLYVRHIVHVEKIPVITLSAPDLDCASPDGYKTTFTVDIANWDDKSTVTQTWPYQAVAQLDGDPVIDPVLHTWHAKYRMDNEAYLGNVTLTVNNTSCRSVSATIGISPTKFDYYAPWMYPAKLYIAKGATLNLINWIQNLSSYTFDDKYDFSSPTASISKTVGTPQDIFTFNTLESELNVDHHISFNYQATFNNSLHIGCRYYQTKTFYPVTADLIINVFDPQIALTASPSISCPNSQTTLTAAVSNVPEGLSCDIEWYNSNDQLIQTDLNTTTAVYLTPSQTSSSTYYVKVVIHHNLAAIGENGDGTYIIQSNPVSFNIYPVHTVVLTMPNGSGGSSEVNNTIIKLCDIADAQLISINVTNPVGGTSPYSYTYQWVKDGNVLSTSKDYQPTAFGNYVVWVDANAANHNCRVIAEFSVQDHTPIAAITDPSPIYACAGANFTLHGTSVAGGSYQWYYRPDPGSSWIPKGTSVNYTDNVDGEYYYEVSNTSPVCQNTSAIVSVTTPPDLTIEQVGGNIQATANCARFYNTTGYQWYFDGVAQSTSFNSYQFATLGTGHYQVSNTKCGVTVYSNIISVNTACAPGNPINWGAGTSLLLSGPYNFTSIDIPAGYTLTLDNAQVTMDPCSQITIENAAGGTNGGKLILSNGTTITGCSDWQGIYVKGEPNTDKIGANLQKHGQLEIQGNLNPIQISDAKIAIYSENGGNIKVDNAIFSFNEMDIAYGTYKNSVSGIYYDQVSFIQNSIFKNLRPVICGTVFTPDANANLSGKYPMVYMENTGGVSISPGCLFRSDLPSLKCIGIAAYNLQESGSGANGLFVGGCTFEGQLDEGMYLLESKGLSVKGSYFGNSATPITMRTGIYAKNSCGSVDGSSSLNRFYYLENGMEVYNQNTCTLSVLHNDFEHNTFGLVAAPEEYPITNGLTGTAFSINTATDYINLDIECNKFYYNSIGIVGSGNLIDQGSSSTSATNNFNGYTGASGSPTSLNTNADVFWQISGNSDVNYYDFPSSGGAVLPPVDYKLSSDISLNYNPHYFTITGISPNSGWATNIQLSPSSTYRFKLTVATSSGSCLGSWKRSLFVKEQTENKIRIYPNPSSSDFIVEFPSISESGRIQAWDMMGRKLLDVPCSSKQKTFNIKAGLWQPGAYQIIFSDFKGYLFEQTVIKVK